MIYLFWTCATSQEATSIVRHLLERKLIACASFFPITSLYRWKGQIEEAREVKVLLKTQAKHFPAIREYILQHSSYEVPELATIPVEAVHPAYLKWLEEETS